MQVLADQRFLSAAGSLCLLACGALLPGPSATAGDVTSPAEVSGLLLDRQGINVNLEWAPVSLDVNGGAETVDHYVVYRSDMPTFPAYRFVGDSATTTAKDLAAADDSSDYFYLVAAVDLAGNEGWLRPSGVTAPPVLSGFTTSSSAELSWSGALPAEEVTGYRVQYGLRSRDYEIAEDVGLDTSFSLESLLPDTGYFFRVAALDQNGNASAFSNEFSAALNGTANIRAQRLSRLCPSYGNCAVADGEIPRGGGQEIIVPVDFPEGEWVNALLTFTIRSDLCIQGVTSKCGQGNAGGWDGWNPCGDPWDRTASVTLALDCLETGSRCYGNSGNLELLHPITPFGTDAPPPQGSGTVPPRVWTYDITPFAPLLEGRQYIAAYIATWVPPGWRVSVDIHVSEDPAEASPEPPADGIAMVSFKDGGNTEKPSSVTIPATASQIIARMFSTGHGNNEFTPRTAKILVNNHAVWSDSTWRTDCGPVNVCTPGSCKDWNACGCPSCTFPRAGWCPGLIACHDNEPCDNDIDLTPFVPAGATYDFQFEVENISAGGSFANSLTIYWYE